MSIQNPGSEKFQEGVFRAGRADPKSKFGVAFGFALFCQGSILFARFLPVFAHFFLPKNGQQIGKNGQIWVCLFLPKFSRICSFSLVLAALSSSRSSSEIRSVGPKNYTVCHLFEKSLSLST